MMKVEQRVDRRKEKTIANKNKRNLIRPGLCSRAIGGQGERNCTRIHLAIGKKLGCVE